MWTLLNLFFVCSEYVFFILWATPLLCVCTAPNVIGYDLAFHVELTGPQWFLLFLYLIILIWGKLQKSLYYCNGTVRNPLIKTFYFQSKSSNTNLYFQQITTSVRLLPKFPTPVWCLKNHCYKYHGVKNRIGQTLYNFVWINTLN